jgi:hypothetical protein
MRHDRRCWLLLSHRSRSLVGCIRGRTDTRVSSNSGLWAATYYDTAGRQHGFVLERGRYKTLDAPGRTDNIAWGINDRGEVVIPEGTVRLLPVATP